MRSLKPLALALALAAGCFAQPGSAVFKKALSASTTTATSANLPNIGQSMHLITVIFPSASAAVTGLQIRLEASCDNVIFFPISADITTAPRLGGITYQLEKAYAPWKFLRVRSLTAPSSPADVWYSGHLKPIISVITALTDRFTL